MRYPLRMKVQFGITISLLSCFNTVVIDHSYAVEPEKGAALQRGDSQTGSLAALAERLLPEVVNVSASATIRPGTAPDTPPDEGGPDSGPDQGPQIPKFAPGSPLDEYFRDYMHQKTAPDAPPREMQAQGSGFIISSDGYIVTNEHVIHNADKISVTLQDGTILPAHIIGRDHRTDLAVLRVKPEGKLPFVTFGNSDAARTGDRVVAIGNPFGLSGTVTSGIISSRSRDIHHGLYNDYLQTDAAINRGNSGGPLFNLAGELIGINTAIFSTGGGSIGLGFAIPVQDAQPVLQQLIKDGHVTRGWIGAQLQEVTPEIAKSLNLRPQQGGLIAKIENNSPSDKVGLKRGDVVTQINGQAVNIGSLARLIAASQPGSRVKLLVTRDGKTHETVVTIGKSPEKPDLPPAGTRDARPRNMSIADLGLTVMALDTELRRSHEIPESQRGVMVVSIAPHSSAAKRGISVGDFILQVQKVEVDTPATFAREIDRLRDQKKNIILFLIQSKDGVSWVPLALHQTLP